MNRAAKLNLVVSTVLACLVACGESDHSDLNSPGGGNAGRAGSESGGAAGNHAGGSSAGSDQTPGGEAAGGVMSAGANGGGASGSTQGGAGKAGNSAGGGFACTLTDPEVCVCETGKANGSAPSCPASDCCVQTSKGCACKKPSSALSCNDVKNYVSGAVIIPSCPP